MRKLRRYYWFALTFFKKHLKIILITALISAFAFKQFKQIISLVPTPKPKLYIGRVGLYTLATLPKDIQNIVSMGLTKIDDSGTAQPALAKDWQVTNEGKTYIFTIRPDAVWQNSTKLQSFDVNYNFNDVSSEQPDDHTIVFNLKESFSPFPVIVSQPIFKRVAVKYLGLFNTPKILGSGQYTITDLKLNGNSIDKITLESDQEKRIYRFYPTESAALTAFKLGEINIVEDLNSTWGMEKWPNVDVIRKLNKHRYAAIFFNTQNPNLSDKSIRQALAYAIPDKPKDDTRAYGPISPTSWVYNPKVKPYDHSIEAAKELLKDTKTDFVLELTTTPAFSKMADAIKASWEQLGITVKLRLVNVPDTDNYEALLIGQQIPQDPDQYLLWHSTQNSNITHYQSPKVDKLLEDGRKELDRQKRKIIYQDFQRFLVEDSPAAFINYLDTITIKRKSSRYD
jgi:peptide/nickel transport system substrate-binding protein